MSPSRRLSFFERVPNMKRILTACLLSGLIALASCGGGSQKSAPPDPPPPGIAPTITQQPASVTVQTGSTATFSVAASGTTPLSYQWSEQSPSGTLTVVGTAPTYTTAATSTSDNNDQFSCVVTNNFGTTTSQTATLTVAADPPPPTNAVTAVVISPSNATVEIGNKEQFSAVVTYTDGSTDSNVTWTAMGAGSVNATGLFSGTAIGTATLTATSVGTNSSGNTVAASIVIAVGGFVATKFGGMLSAPASGGDSARSYWYSFDLDEDSLGNLTTENGLTVSEADQPTIACEVAGVFTPGCDVPTPPLQNGVVSMEEPFSGTATPSTLQLTATMGSNGTVSLVGSNVLPTVTGTFTSPVPGTDAPLQGGTFSFTAFALLNGTWAGSAVYGSGGFPVSVTLTETAPTSSTPRQFAGSINIDGITGTFDGSNALVQGDVFEILPSASVVCQVLGQMLDPAGNSIVLFVGTPNVSQPNCPVGPSDQIAVVVQRVLTN